MKIVKYQIKVPYTKNNTETVYTATLTSYTLDIFNETGRRKSPAVIISPGGGYYAEVINSDGGALGGDTIVDVHKKGSLDFLIFKISESSQK